jgi:hypothetical protein
MKKCKTTFLSLAILLTCNIVSAQHQQDDNTPAKPRWYSDKGYWLVESNINSPENAIVSFYTADRKLVYKEQVSGVVLDCNKRKTLMKLKRTLEKVVDKYGAGSEVASGQELTAMFVPKKKSS